MENKKTMVEIWDNDRLDLHLLKIRCKAKNLPQVLHEVIQTYKKYQENKQNAN